MSKSDRPGAGDPPEAPARADRLAAVVAVGASAGGLEAFQRLLNGLPADTGMAFVMILHLSPSHESGLSQILARSARMPVRTIEQDMVVEPNTIYVVPPGVNVAYLEGRFDLSPRIETGIHHPIDAFMRSLAMGIGERSIGVILSGTGDDGTLGIADIKAAGGIGFAQDASAQQEAMPRSAVKSGEVDFVLPPEDIAAELARIAAHPFGRTDARSLAELTDEAALQRLFEMLRRETGMVFNDYRRNTISRRILRRMAVHRIDRLPDYVQYASSHPPEVEALHGDILINVTSFFRDPEAFDAVKNLVFPQINEGEPEKESVRIWVVGCSTGQDAYSVAMAYMEAAKATGSRTPLQVFATDARGHGIQSARAGIYPKSIEQDMSPQRLKEFFTEFNGGYRVSKTIRDMCVFAQHDALSEPPFSRVDLVMCRNLLIYLEPVLQRKLLPTLHYALGPRGFLWLGSSESASNFDELFEVVSSKHRIYRRKPGVKSRVDLASPEPAQRTAIRPFLRPVPERDPQRDAERMLLARYSPPAVVVDADFNVLQFRGDTSSYLVPPQGRASLNLLKMLREGLLVGVRGALHRARRENRAVREENLRVRSDGGSRKVSIVAIPFGKENETSGTVLVFEEAGEGVAAQARQDVAEQAEEISKAPPEEKPHEEALRLRQELAATREYLQSLVEQLETANEELQASNEEAHSSNEELQSVNEELETSKEEIQSTNEELTTVNEELKTRNLELSQSNSDFANLLASIQMPLVMLDRDLKIRLFTSAAESLLQLRSSDIGRPLSHFKLNLEIEGLDEILRRVLQDGAEVECETRDHAGRWQWVRVRPYRGAANEVTGAILIVIDIDRIKRADQRLTESEARFAVLADSAPVLMWVHGLDGCQFVNHAYETFVGASADALSGSGWVEFIHHDDRESVLAIYREALASRRPFEYVCRFRRSDGKFRWMKSNGAERRLEDGEFAGFAGTSVDISDLKEAEDGLRNADRAKDEFLATLGHELRNPLAAISNAAYILSSQAKERGSPALDIIERQTRHMVHIVDDLLDVSRITHGKINLRLRPVSLESVARSAIGATDHERRRNDQAIDASFPAEPIWVLADASRIEQIFTNLLGNASKFSPVGGRISISIRREKIDGEGEDKAVVHVIDNGPGIDPAVLPRVFELFVQGSRVDDRARIGVGIGLALSRHLVSLHGGTIEARNLPAGGSELIVWLPVIAAPAAAVRDEPASGPPVEARRVVVVDDNADAAKAVADVLALLGHYVEVAASGRDAIDIAQRLRPDVMFLDVGLPDLDGYAVARELRQDVRTRHIRLVALTGYGRAEDEERAREAGFDLHLKKPAEPADLARAFELSA